MARTPTPYTYNVETLANISGWPVNRIHQDASREGLDLASFVEACFWVASNAAPEIRAEMAKRLIPPVLGARRRTDENEALFSQASSYDLMLEIFKRDRLYRDARARKIRRIRRQKR